jgi:glycerol-3-phosphate acyltransferase PlsX
MARLDPNSVNGGPLLGLNGVVVKSHGGANDVGFCNAVLVAADLAQSRFADEIRANLQQLTDVLARPAEEGSSS